MIPAVKAISLEVGQDARDNAFTGRSPCIGCEHENHDKNDCIDKCKRLKACQAYQPIPQASKPLKTLINENEAKLKLIVWPTTKTGLKPVAQELVKQRRTANIKPKTNLKPVAPKLVEQHHEPNKCLICGKPETDKRKLQRGICKTPCYSFWQQGKVLHPIIGEFVKLTREEIAQGRAKGFKKCLIPGCRAVGDKRKLCQSHYYKWYYGSLKHPKYGIFKKVFGVKK